MFIPGDEFAGPAKTGSQTLKTAAGADSRALKAVEALPCNCFVAGTQVQTSRGSKSIEHIEVDDKVWATDLETGRRELRRVTALFQKQAHSVMTITVASGHKVTVTKQHPFYVTGVGWVMSGDLRVGDRLAQRNGGSAPITTIDERSAGTTVYNFTVAGDHNYYVTEAQLLVHNCSYVDLTRPGSVRNVGTDVTHTDFADNLVSGGWMPRTSKDGAVQIFQKDGAKYVLRQKNSSGYPGWTADFTPAGSKQHILEIRLGYTP